MKPLFQIVKFVTVCVLFIAVANVCNGQGTDTSKKQPASGSATVTNATQNGTNTNPTTTKAADSTTLKKYKAPRVFTGNVALTESDKAGVTPANPGHPIAQKGQGFDVIGIAANGDLILRMWVWTLKTELPDSLVNRHKDTLVKYIAGSKMNNNTKLDLYKRVDIVSKRQSLNFKQFGEKSAAPLTINQKDEGDNVWYFTMNKDIVEQVSTIEASSQKWDIQFGILTVPTKIRFGKFAFTNNAGIGTAVFFERKFKHSQNWSWGLVPSFSLTSVTLDAASTNVHASDDPASAIGAIKTSTTRPAFTPSISYVIAYKNINFILGAGMDFISKPSSFATDANPEAGWIYNGKPWLGIGFGVSLFGNNSSGSTASATGDQSPTNK